MSSARGERVRFRNMSAARAWIDLPPTLGVFRVTAEWTRRGLAIRANSTSNEGDAAARIRRVADIMVDEIEPLRRREGNLVELNEALA